MYLYIMEILDKKRVLEIFNNENYYLVGSLYNRDNLDQELLDEVLGELYMEIETIASEIGGEYGYELNDEGYIEIEICSGFTLLNTLHRCIRENVIDIIPIVDNIYNKWDEQINKIKDERN